MIKSEYSFVHLTPVPNSFFSSMAKRELGIEDGQYVSFYIDPDTNKLYISIDIKDCPTCYYLRRSANPNLIQFTYYSSILTPGKYKIEEQPYLHTEEDRIVFELVRQESKK